MFPIYNHHPPYYHNSTLTLSSIFYFVFKLHFKRRSFFFFLSNISQFLKIAQHLNHKPLPTRSQFSSYWLWFIDEQNSQLC